MSKQRENLAFVHLQIDALNSFKAVWISLFDIFDPQVLIVKLLSCNFGCNSLVVPSIKVLKLKWIRQSLRQSLPSQTYLLLTTHRDIVLLNRFQLSEPHASSLIDVFSSVALFATAAREAEAYRLSLSVIFWEHSFQVGGDQREKEERGDEHADTKLIRVIVDDLRCIVEVHTRPASLKFGENTSSQAHGNLRDDREEDFDVRRHIFAEDRDAYDLKTEVYETADKARVLRALKEGRNAGDLGKERLCVA